MAALLSRLDAIFQCADSVPRAQFVKGEDEGKLSSGGGGKKNKAAAEGIFLEIKFSRLVSMFFKNILPPIDIDS